MNMMIFYGVLPLVDRGEFEPHLFPGDVCILCSARGDGVRLRRFFLASSIIFIPSCPPSSWQINCTVAAGEKFIYKYKNRFVEYLHFQVDR